MDDNFFKSVHGNNGIKNLKDMILFYKNKGYIMECTEQIRTGYDEYSNDQFHFQFLVMFSNGDKWIIQSTTSIRSDRINIQQWNAMHIKRLIKGITAAIIVYPDSINSEEKDNAIKYNNKILNKEIFSAIDYVISLDDLLHMIEDNYLKSVNTGRKKCIQGDNFEEQIIEILNNKQNIIKWNSDEAKENSIETGFNYPYFHQIMASISANEFGKINSIEATRKIPLLPSGGKPKTDILLIINFDNKISKKFSFSCKRTSSKWVSVHEYPVKRFVEALSIKDQKLVHALEAFQQAGGEQVLKETGAEYAEYLENELPKYNEELSYWALGGKNGDGSPEIQWANYIITYKNETGEFKVHNIEEYIGEMSHIKGQFGTPFKWTYPSGGKGKRIQLKGIIL